MPQEPKKRHSRQRQGKRRAAINFNIKSALACPNCGTFNAPHTICRNCGYYKGRSVTAKKEEAKKEEPKPSEAEEEKSAK